MHDLRRVDLNLLVSLQALLTERNVTRAAQRLSLSQSAVSGQLARLREHFGDPLLVPAAKGMLPTAKALSLMEPLSRALAGIEEVLQADASFDPAFAGNTWVLAAADYVGYAVGRPLVASLHQRAPHTRLAMREALPAAIAKQAETGEIDAAFLAADMCPPSLRARLLYHEEYVLVARKGHPAFERALTPEAFCRLEHVIVSPKGAGFRGPTDVQLERAGMQRRVALSVAHFLLVPEVIACTDFVAMLPSRLMADRREAFHVGPPPLPVPGFEIHLVWHERSQNDPAHVWLREQIVDCV